MNEVMRLVLWMLSFATEVVLLFKLGRNEVLKSVCLYGNRKKRGPPLYQKSLGNGHLEYGLFFALDIKYK
ncbi:hypothetical protein FACS189430_10130 [Bacteroidia bacterium]|nr:hypothetical protein FACS189430_10130 [Bacteroidia bacterium]